MVWRLLKYGQMNGNLESENLGSGLQLTNPGILGDLSSVHHDFLICKNNNSDASFIDICKD